MWIKSKIKTSWRIILRNVMVIFPFKKKFITLRGVEVTITRREVPWYIKCLNELVL